MTHKDLISSYLESRATKVHMDDLRDEQKTALGRAVFIVSQSELNAFPELKQNTEFLRFVNLFSEI